jgi:hypothetical protein
MSAKECRENAGKCLELAELSIEQSIRLGLLDMAHAWLRLAEQAEKNAEAHLAYRPSAQRRDGTHGNSASMQRGLSAAA